MDKVNYENLQREVYQAVMNRMDFNKDFSDREIMDLSDSNNTIVENVVI